MPRGIAWDELPLPHERHRPETRAATAAAVPEKPVQAEPPVER